MGAIKDLIKSIRQKKQLNKFKRKEPPVLIYQMGKVASSSIYRSLVKYYSGGVFHSHALDSENSTHVKLLNYGKSNNQKLKLISLVREPISRNISAFFQNFQERYADLVRNDSVSEMMKVFIDSYPHDIPLQWFDQRMKVDFGIDIYNHPFSHEGYTIVENDVAELLVMKHDLNNDLKSNLVSDFIGISSFQILNKNVSSKKSYDRLYKEFKKLSLPQPYINQMYDSKYMRHFYREMISKNQESQSNND